MKLKPNYNIEIVLECNGHQYEEFSDDEIKSIVELITQMRQKELEDIENKLYLL